jgi:purine-nucleoside phosphorylase
MSESISTYPHSDKRATEDESAAFAADSISRSLGRSGAARCSVGIILGSGLGAAAERLLANGGKQLPYHQIPGMPPTSVVGHCGRLVMGDIGSTSVVMLQGRAHFYEGHSPAAIVFATRVLMHLGVTTLIVTNAAGGIRTGLQPGNLMLIENHLRPLSACGLSFQAITSPPGEHHPLPQQRSPWCSSLRSIAMQVPTPLKVHQGVYAMMTGPNYETPAEIRMLQTLGADAVGMSTIPEAIFAASRGIRVLGISCITNIAAGLSHQTLNHREVTATASSIEDDFVDWILRLVPQVSLKPA